MALLKVSLLKFSTAHLFQACSEHQVVAAMVPRCGPLLE